MKGTTLPIVVRVIAALLVVLVASAARADSRVDFLADRLRHPPPAGQADDFRVRTNAALALGATNDDAAVAPLCSGLGDPSDVVRQAVAIALRRLARASSLDCLRRRMTVETNVSVRLQLRRAIDVIEASGGPSSVSPDGRGAPATSAAAKFYVALSPVTNNTSRSTAEVERVVHDAIASKLGQLGEFQIAPSGEASEAARAVLSKHRLKGFYLAISVDKFDYSDASLRVHVKIAIFSYPGRDLRGEVPAGATLPGARPGDKAAEDELMSVVAARAAELFAQNFK
jgi:hypothetical protein